MNNKLALALTMLATSGFAGEPTKENVVPPAEEQWRFSLAIPGWLPGLDGDTGVNGLVSQVDLDPGDVFRHYDIAATFRTETSKGRFGITTDFLYTSLSDGIGTDTILQKLDIQVDQTIAELAFRWRIIESPRGFLDVVGGVRYTNLFQQIVTQPSDSQIEASVEEFGDEFSDRVRGRIDEALSEQRLRNALSAAVRERITSTAAGFTGPNPPEQKVPNGPLAGPNFGRLGRALDNLVQRKAREVISAAASEARAAAQAELAAGRATTAAARATAQRRAAELRASVNRRIANARADVESEMERKLHNGLDQRVARTDDWWDPFIGLRARYNINDRFYASARGDLGGFGVGSDFTWQAEVALGHQLSERVFVEVGYRAFGVDYDKDGLLYDVVMHGAQVTMGIQF